MELKSCDTVRVMPNHSIRSCLDGGHGQLPMGGLRIKLHLEIPMHQDIELAVRRAPAAFAYAAKDVLSQQRVYPGPAFVSSPAPDRGPSECYERITPAVVLEHGGATRCIDISSGSDDCDPSRFKCLDGRSEVLGKIKDMIVGKGRDFHGC
jgi:hypothetical protein